MGTRWFHSMPPCPRGYSGFEALAVLLCVWFPPFSRQLRKAIAAHSPMQPGQTHYASNLVLIEWLGEHIVGSQVQSLRPETFVRSPGSYNQQRRMGQRCECLQHFFPDVRLAIASAQKDGNRVLPNGCDCRFRCRTGGQRPFRIGTEGPLGAAKDLSQSNVVVRNRIHGQYGNGADDASFRFDRYPRAHERNPSFGPSVMGKAGFTDRKSVV